MQIKQKSVHFIVVPVKIFVSVHIFHSEVFPPPPQSNNAVVSQISYSPAVTNKINLELKLVTLQVSQMVRPV